MKRLLLSFILCLGCIVIKAQTATDFTAPDCAGNSYNLFSDLDAGKIVVITWTMPCGACVGGALTAYNIVQSYEATYPGKVKMLLADDFGNTACSAINSWASSNGITRAIKFSDASIRMSDYGITGMPKTIAIAPDHTVFFNQNNGVNPDTLQAAIDGILSTTATKEIPDIISNASVYPNPANQSAVVTLGLIKSEDVAIDVYDLNGKELFSVYHGQCITGKNEIPFNTSQLSTGLYQIRIAGNNKMMSLQLLISR